MKDDSSCYNKLDNTIMPVCLWASNIFNLLISVLDRFSCDEVREEKEVSRRIAKERYGKTERWISFLKINKIDFFLGSFKNIDVFIRWAREFEWVLIHVCYLSTS